MAKLVKKKRKLTFLTKCSLVLSISLLCWLFASVYVGSIITSLTIDIQKMNSEADVLKAENKQLNIEIQTLQNKDRVYTIAADAGLEQKQSNVVNIEKGGMNEAE